MMKFENQSLHINSLLPRFLVIAGVLLFAPYTLLITWSSLFSTMPLAFASFVGLWQFFLSWLLLAHAEVYVFTCVGFIILSILGMIIGHPSRKQVAALVLVLGMVCLFVFAPYRPAVKAANGYHMVVPTAPSFFMRGLKNAQAVAEVTPCQYRLLGWQQETLFYQSECKNEKVRTWQFSPEAMQQPIEYFDSSPQDLYGETLSHEATLAQVVADNIYPLEAEYAVRSLYVPKSGLLSPSGKWLALISQHLYSTQDVILVTPE